MKKEIQVTPENFNVKLLYKAACEGRLRLIVDDYETDQVGFDIDEMRAYVQRIKPFVTHQYKNVVDDIWEQVLSTAEFIELLKPERKPRKCKVFNKYSVMRLIGVLRELGVYEQRSDRKFNALLEQTTQDSPYRKYLSMGLARHDFLVKLRQIVTQIQNLTFG